VQPALIRTYEFLNYHSFDCPPARDRALVEVARAYEAALKTYNYRYLNRVVVISNGADNVSPEAEATIARHAEDSDRQGIYHLVVAYAEMLKSIQAPLQENRAGNLAALDRTEALLREASLGDAELESLLGQLAAYRRVVENGEQFPGSREGHRPPGQLHSPGAAGRLPLPGVELRTRGQPLPGGFRRAFRNPVARPQAPVHGTRGKQSGWGRRAGFRPAPGGAGAEGPRRGEELLLWHAYEAVGTTDPLN